MSTEHRVSEADARRGMKRRFSSSEPQAAIESATMLVTAIVTEVDAQHFATSVMASA